MEYLIDLDFSEQLIDLINYMYEVGFMVGCLFSERYYTSNVQKKAVFLAYSLSILSGLSLGIYKIFLKSSGEYVKSVIIVGYGLSGIGQSLLIILMVAYATPYVKSYPNTGLIPILLGLLNFSGLVGALLNYLITNIGFNTDWILLAITIIILLLSFAISWNLKGIPRVYIINNEMKPEIPFSYFSVSFYTYGVIFAIYSSVLPKILYKYSNFSYNKELLVFQGIYSIFYLFGSAFLAYTIFKEKETGRVLVICGGIILITGALITNLPKNILKKNSFTLWVIDIGVSTLGFTGGIIEPIILHKIVTRSNRPEFFTGLFYFLASISGIMVISLPP